LGKKKKKKGNKEKMEIQEDVVLLEGIC